jgi:1-deoxy-D-xylulose-5-phosphate synthase
MPDKVVEHGSQPELWAECGYDETAIIETSLHLLGIKETVVSF